MSMIKEVDSSIKELCGLFENKRAITIKEGRFREMSSTDNQNMWTDKLVGIINCINNRLEKIYNRQNYTKADTENIIRSLNSFSKLSIPCQIMSMTPKQLYIAYKGGWTLDQLSGLSGYTEKDINTKINNYIQSNN